MHLKEIEMENFKSFGRKIAVPFLEGYTAITGPNGSGKCVDGSTRILLTDGEERTIEGLVEHALRHSDVNDAFDDGLAAYENPEDVEVLTLDPRTLRFQRAPVIAFVKREAPDRLLQIRTRTGRRIAATPYHPLFSVHEGRLVCPRADQLGVGNLVAAYLPPPAELEEAFEARDAPAGEGLVVLREPHPAWTSGVLWDAIESIEWVNPPSRWVYDLSVPGTHNFVADGLVAHNSNIADAILFVLGPKSAKAIRAGRLTDLIWNGGKQKKGASNTTVSLLFDNRDRVIPIEADDVRLTRKVLLSPTVEGGYNSYFYVNGRKSQLQEFDQLLAHARISAEGYNLVQQGDVQRIVQMSNLDRRRTLDDIAGITKFDEDIHAAEGKRAAAEDNLERIRIIIEEIDKQLLALKEDRGAALKYRELKGRLDLARAQLVHKNKAIVEEAIAGAREQLHRHEEERAKLEAEKEALRRRRDEAVQALQDLERQIVEHGGEEARRTQEELNALRIERATKENEVEKARDAEKALAKEAAQVDKDRARVRKDVQALEKERAEIAKAHEKAAKALAALDEEMHAAEGDAAKSDKTVQALQGDLAAAEAAVDGLEERLRALTLEADRHADAIARLGAEIAQLDETRGAYALELEDAEFQIQEAKGSTKDSTKSAKRLQEAFFAKRKEEAELSKEAQELENAILGLTREVERLRAESQLADAMKKGYSQAVAAILEAREKGAIRGIHGTVAELAEVDRKYETAMHVAAGNRMQAIVVDTDAVASECIDYLKRTRAGRAAFLPLNKMLAGRPRGKAVMAAKEAVGFAIDLIAFDDKYRDAFYYVFGDTVVVATLDQARTLMGGVRLVTLEGELIEASGAMIGGRIEKPSVSFGDERPGDLKAVEKRLREATAQADKLRERLAAVRRELADVETQLKDAGMASGSVEGRLDVLEAKRKEFAARVKAGDDDRKERDRRLAELRKAAAKAAKALEAVAADLAAKKSERDAQKKRLVDATPAKVATALREMGARRGAAQEEFHATAARLETIDAQRKVQADRLAELDARRQAIQGEADGDAAQVEAHTARLKELAKEVRALEGMSERMDKEVRALQARRDDAYKEKTDLEGAMDRVGQKIDTKESMALSLQAALQDQEARLRQAEEELAALQVEVSGDLPSLETLKRRISEAESQMNALGNVNLRALEDYEEQEARHKELGEEYERLETQRKELLQLVDELNGKKKDGLLMVFEAINTNFKNVYAELSEGGEAELVLENPDDPLAGGLIIKAKPPHKKVLRLEALSGGEKSLVSMAFLVAIQQYDPSPFYLLDEVDQNLDAVNAEKVARMVSRNAHTAQFVQISLRKVTLKEADHIVGVTMRTDGISEVVMKVNLADVPDERPREEVAA